MATEKTLVRYLQGRCLRLESCRKALVWQKRYLQRVVAGYLELERALRPRNAEHAEPAEHSRGRKRFKCVALGVVCVLRMAFLVRRRQHVRALAGAALLRARDLPAHAHAPHTTPSGPRPRPSDAPAPCTPDPGPSPAPARRALRMSLPTPSAVGDYTRGSPCASEEPFILSSPRGEVAASYLNKLELVSRCLNQAMEAPRDVP